MMMMMMVVVVMVGLTMIVVVVIVMPKGGHYHFAVIKRNRNDAKMVPWLCTLAVEEKKLEVFSRASRRQ